MKVLRVSNFDHEDYRGNQWFVAQRLSKRQAEAVTRVLNEMEGEEGENFFLVVTDDHKPREDWEP